MIVSVFSRQRLIQDCIKSFSIFDETLAKAHEGMEFYKKVFFFFNFYDEKRDFLFDSNQKK